MTQVYGILGWPVKHSRSPAMQNAAFAEKKIDATYLPFAVRPENLKQAVRGAMALGLAGFNVTVPHKEQIIPWLDEIDDTAKLCGAVNTVCVNDGHCVGYNTDIEGLEQAILNERATVHGNHVLIWGSGGAARAAVIACCRAKAAKVTVAARNLVRAQAIAQQLSHACSASIEAIKLQDSYYSQIASQANVMINATSATLHPGPSAEEFISKLELEHCKPNAFIMDLAYATKPTPLLEKAQERGLKAVDGRDMLVYQGAAAFRIWTGKDPNIEVMRAALQQGLLQPGLKT